MHICTFTHLGVLTKLPISPIFRKKTAMSQKKFSMGKNFPIRYFRLKTRFGPFKIDSDQKTFFEKFSIFWSFLPFWGQKIDFFEFLGWEILNFFHPFQKDCIAVILRYCTPLYAKKCLRAQERAVTSTKICTK